MSRLFFVRHAEVVLDPERRAAEWLLSESGADAAARLAGDPRFAHVERVATSPEPKAVATAAPLAARLGLALHEDHGLREVERGRIPILERSEYVALVRRYLAGEPVEAWEPADEARARFRQAVASHRAVTPGDLAIVSHGLVISLHLGLTAERWEAVRMPDVLEVEE